MKMMKNFKKMQKNVEENYEENWKTAERYEKL